MNIVLRNHLPTHLRRAAFDDSFERLMHSVFDTPFDPATQTARTVQPAVNVKETAEAYVIEAELPGVRKEDVRISFDQGRISISAETVQTLEQKEGEKLLRSERLARKFARSFVLPEEVNEDGADATLDHGILTLTLPKKPTTQPKQITVR